MESEPKNQVGQADQTAVDNINSESESTSKRQKQGPPTAAFVQRRCVQIAGTEYYDGDLQQLPSVKYLVPANWLERIATTLIMISMCISGEEQDEDIASYTLHEVKKLPPAERDLVLALSKRSSVLSPEAYIIMGRKNTLDVQLRAENDTQRMISRTGQQYDSFYESCRQIATEEAKEKQENHISVFEEECREGDNSLFSYRFMPVDTILAPKNAKPEVHIVLTKILE